MPERLDAWIGRKTERCGAPWSEPGCGALCIALLAARSQGAEPTRLVLRRPARIGTRRLYRAAHPGPARKAPATPRRPYRPSQAASRPGATAMSASGPQ
jgi:hypothetical protein